MNGTKNIAIFFYFNGKDGSKYLATLILASAHLGSSNFIRVTKLFKTFKA
jgi:hypothetical protein